jgi:glycolate oxidase subunit GlcD
MIQKILETGKEMLSKEVKDSLKFFLTKEFGSPRVIDDLDILETYSKDETSDLESFPDLLFRAETPEEISSILKYCNEHEIPVVPRGAGTGVTGGAVPVIGGLVLSLEKMNRIIEIDKDNMVAVVEPGAITGDIQQAVLEHDLFYPPDPASLDICSIGGNVAENAGGPSAVKYGITKDYILGLEFVLADGSIIKTGGKYVKNATGYNLTGIIIGSEGTLVVITKIFIRLISAPLVIKDMLIPFESLEDAIDSVLLILRNRILPSTIEFMEKNAISLVSEFLSNKTPFPFAKALLLIEFDGNDEDLIYSQMGKISDLVKSDSNDIIVAETKEQRERLWKTRRSIRESIHLKSPVFLAEDCVVPRSKIPEFIKTLDKYFDEKKLDCAMFGHAGDGNVHIDVLKGNMEYSSWKEMLPGLKEDIYKIAISFGGTITGEHGIGYIRKDFLHLALSDDEIILLKRIKKAFDPNFILNPHKIFD